VVLAADDGMGTTQGPSGGPSRVIKEEEEEEKEYDGHK
jgi:hypothetical protein